MRSLCTAQATGVASLAKSDMVQQRMTDLIRAAERIDYAQPLQDKDGSPLIFA